MSKVSIIVPSRNEQFLVKTVDDLLAKARGDIEILVVLEGYWEPALSGDPRVRQIHHGSPMGMRPSINEAVLAARGDYLMKADAHTMWGEGFDEILKAEYQEDNWILVPRRFPLEPETWTLEQRKDSKYPIDYHYLSYPFERPNDETCGLHGTEWRFRREQRKDILLDDEMSSQGSGWFMSRKHWDRLGPMEISKYGNFIHEFQELGLKTWLGGGAVKVTKRTWYAHLYKGRKYGRGYSLGATNHKIGSAFCTDYWMNDRWPERVRNLRWLVEHFAPVPSWPSDLDRAFAPRPSVAIAAKAPAYSPTKSERRSGPMEVLSAKYGLDENNSADVTETVKKLVTPEGLSLKVGNALLEGDPYPGQRKRLFVTYKVGDAAPISVSTVERKTLTITG